MLHEHVKNTKNIGVGLAAYLHKIFKPTAQHGWGWVMIRAIKTAPLVSEFTINSLRNQAFLSQILGHLFTEDLRNKWKVSRNWSNSGGNTKRDACKTQMFTFKLIKETQSAAEETKYNHVCACLCAHLNGSFALMRCKWRKALSPTRSVGVLFSFEVLNLGVWRLSMWFSFSPPWLSPENWLLLEYWQGCDSLFLFLWAFHKKENKKHSAAWKKQGKKYCS